ncbi:hypothetical protein [Shewanella sp. GXUN23E]|uniref:NADH-quinone oxidoreductase subunit B family protein n=1 Tax=Shewanella sp. GXUN23E TaxID=3422498 RepID=UPI003D7D7D99
MSSKVLWLQSGGCGGCSMSLLNAETPHLFNQFSRYGLELLWHPSLSELDGRDLLTLLQAICDGVMPLDILCLEGAVLRGPEGSGRFHMLGPDQPMMHWLRLLAAKARMTVAIGSCAAFGGITSAGENPAQACGLQFEGAQPGGLLAANWQSLSGFPVINIAGCPTHPDWVMETLGMIAKGMLDHAALDSFNRPAFYTRYLVHHGCPRNEFYEYKASAERPAQQGCMMEHMGCLGTQAHADCNIRSWNGQGSCLKGGYPCINCTAPEFEEPQGCFVETRKIAGIPVGLPTDMPKAWFVALASLSKAAMPARLKDNATAESIVTPPIAREKKR